ncbi:MAG: tyrosine-type recombinase/integrase [Beijerinckiaceae bacterium]
MRRGGAAAHLAQVTRDDLERRYGYFLDHLARAGVIDLTAAAAGQVAPDRVADFVTELRTRVSSVTLAQTISKVRRMAEILAPERDLEWLRDIERELAFDAVPQSRAGQLVDGARLLEAGLVMIKEGELGQDMPLLKRARLIRDGLMVALLSLCPIRLRNLAALEIGADLRNDAGAWWIALDRRATKERRPDERPLHDVLKRPVELYLAVARPILLREMTDWVAAADLRSLSDLRGAVWIDSNLGRPMSYSGVEQAVAEATRKALGVTLRPHMFRSCTATTAYIVAGDNPHLASALLQHTDQRVTQKHYNRATNTQASITYSELIDAELKSTE